MDIEDSEDEDNFAFRLIRFSCSFAEKNISINTTFGKIPFLLMEDLLEGETIAIAEAIWSKIESIVRQLALTSTSTFQKSNLVFKFVISR